MKPICPFCSANSDCNFPTSFLSGMHCVDVWGHLPRLFCKVCLSMHSARLNLGTWGATRTCCFDLQRQFFESSNRLCGWSSKLRRFGSGPPPEKHKPHRSLAQSMKADTQIEGWGEMG